MKHLLLIALSAATAACATVPPSGGSQSAVVRLNQTATVAGLRVRPLQVVEDSRCPINARCVWAGRMTVRVAMSGRGGEVTRNITLGEPVDHAGGRLALVSAEPGRMAGAPPTPPSDYRFAFEYTR